MILGRVPPQCPTDPVTRLRPSPTKADCVARKADRAHRNSPVVLGSSGETRLSAIKAQPKVEPLVSTLSTS